MWKIDEIKEKQRIIQQKMDECNNPKLKELLGLSLVTYSCLLDNSGTIKYTMIPNVIDKITNNNFTNKREQELAKLEYDLMVGDEAYLDDDYLSILLQICDNVSNTDKVEIDESLFKKINVSPESLINLSRNFYQSLGDTEIFDCATKILDDPSSLNFSSIPRRGMTDCSGLTFNDYVYDKTYCNITRQNNIFDYQVFNHEVMHGIDFYLQKKVPSENYFGFHEVPTYTIDYLFIDYLESQGLDICDVQLLRQQKDNYLQSLANITKIQLQTLLMKNYGFKGSQTASLEEIRKVITPQLKKQLLEIQSGVMSFGLFSQIIENKEYGINNLKQLMKRIISKECVPDFTDINLSYEEILEYSKMIGMYSKNIKSSKNL